ncbi:signal peptidase I [Streptomyces tateyamensis]|uniref:Signal peptidase I n=1 Tax=Streptomyces tateyamensis TaxID=565073 RepID=A0A2V4NG86_9ACTN|nr:signal peptidase I [Streptomyces tateyamensis]PYC79154.1 signal peptidase I [Streptomyces tateyamensis]
MSSLADEAPGPAAAPAAPAPAPRSRRLWGVLQGIALTVGLVLLVGGFVLTAVEYRPSFVPTASMSPTIAAGDTVLVHPLGKAAVGRGDIVVFKDPQWGDETLVKRVIGVGGDTVVCCDPQGRITVNGVPVTEPYLADGLLTAQPSGSAGDAGGSLAGVAQQQLHQTFNAQVPAGRLFVLGDNRLGSLDSRVHLDQLAGSIPVDGVSGRVAATVWPFGHWRTASRTTAFDALPGPAAGQPGPLMPLIWAMLAGTAVIVLVSLTTPAAAVVRWARRRR